MTCECDGATALGVAACDTEKTHCCVSPSVACGRFCEVHQMKWTGGSTPDKDPGAGTAALPCDEPCKDAKDCGAVTCQCAHGTADGVAACNADTHCCGDTRVVCEHFCRGKKGKWTGKLAGAPPPPDGRDWLGIPPAAPAPSDSDDL